MAASFNRVILSGNLTRDPELRHTTDGTPVCDFGIAVDRPRSRQEDAVDYFNVTSWRKLAEIIAEHKSKGDGVLLEGRLQFDSWENDEGQKRTAVKVVADDVQFLGSAGSNNGNGSANGSGASGGTRQAAAHGRDQAGEVADDDDGFDEIPF